MTETKVAPADSSHFVHVLLSEAGEPEAGMTEFASRVTRDESQATSTFRSMEMDCLDFIDRQREIIESIEGMRRYNELAYGDAAASYLYRVFWFRFPDALPGEAEAADWARHFLCADDPTMEDALIHLHQYAGLDSKKDGLMVLMGRICSGLN